MGKIPLWEIHWFQLKDSFLVELKDGILKGLIQKGINKSGNLFQLSKLLNFSCPTFYNFVNNKGVKMVSLGKLKALLNYLDIDYSFLNGKIKMTKKEVLFL